MVTKDNESCGSREMESSPVNSRRQRRKLEVTMRSPDSLNSNSQEAKEPGFDDQLGLTSIASRFAAASLDVNVEREEAFLCAIVYCNWLMILLTDLHLKFDYSEEKANSEDEERKWDLGLGSDYGLLVRARIACLAEREDKKKNARNLGSPPGLYVHRPEIEELKLKLGIPSPSFPPFLSSRKHSLSEMDVLIRVIADIKTTATITEESTNLDLYESHVSGFVFFDNSEPMNPVNLVLAHSHEISECLPYLNIEANHPPMSSLAFANLTRLCPLLQKTNPIQFPAQSEWHAHSHCPTIKASKYA
ncbi:hypothetical protein Acr_14g0001180 [Actinidia rufa]|uniref:Uncharacterized protein n=1 Tax=Actinidia rufa TaxID=165716 RepID=A0A7J0FP35_9ERIC|nr:hypothetical protein Acr_14g0001180 [Actinidia rufa]